MSRPKHMRRQGRLYMADDNKITLDRITGAILGTEDPLRFPVSYPAIDFDPGTKKMFIQGCAIIATGIVVGSVMRGMVGR